MGDNASGVWTVAQGPGCALGYDPATGAVRIVILGKDNATNRAFTDGVIAALTRPVQFIKRDDTGPDMVVLDAVPLIVTEMKG